MGPSVGWVWAPVGNVLPIIAAGTYTLDPSVSLVTVSVAGLVTVVLPSAINPTIPAGAQPGLFVGNAITIVDIGGNAGTFAVTIQPKSGAENIMGLSSITISVNYGGYSLLPSSILKGWNSISP